MHIIRSVTGPNDTFHIKLQDSWGAPRFNVRLVKPFLHSLTIKQLVTSLVLQANELEQALFAYRARLQQFERVGATDATTIRTLCVVDELEIATLRKYVLLISSGTGIDFEHN